MTCLYPYKCPNRVEATTWNEVSHGKQSWVCGCTGPLEKITVAPLPYEPACCPDGVHSMFDPCPGDCQCVCPDPPRAIDFECPLPHNPFAPKSGVPASVCVHQETWFDRSVCAEPCGSMHDRCTECGSILGYCAIERLRDWKADHDAGMPDINAKEDPECISASQPRARMLTWGDMKRLKRWLRDMWRE